MELDVEKFGYSNNVGRMHGRSPAEQEQASRRHIEEMRQKARESARSRHTQKKSETDVVVEGAIPLALLYGLKRQYGNSILRDPVNLLRSQGLLFRDN